MLPLQALKKYFNISQFRSAQEDIINAILHGNNVLAVLPTGAGKSLCYQIPALVSENFSIVVSPLIALMKDQVDQLNRNEELAAFINSSMSFYEAEQVLQKIAFGKIKILYVAPERLESINFTERIKKLNPNYLFVDEAHCISQWGHNFRPSYAKIRDFVDYVEIKKISGFTATATPEVVKDIVEQLKMKEPQVFVRGFERDNIHISVQVIKKKKEKCLELLKTFETPAIIYTASRKNAEEAAEYLTLHRINCSYYHAGLQPEIRRKIQEDFLEDKIKVIVATNAFGMGINKKDIRLLIHYNTPGSIENYYQEIGRAGRDGKPSHAFLLYDDYDINIQNFFLSASHPDKALIQSVYSAICDYAQIAVGNLPGKEISINYDYISAYAKQRISRGMLYACIKILETAGYLKLLSDFERKASIQFLIGKEKLKDYITNTSNNLLREIVLYLLREHGGKGENGRIQFSAKSVANKLNFDEADINEALSSLNNIGIADYNLVTDREAIILTAPRVKPEELRLDYKRMNEHYLNLQQKINLMIDYVFSPGCRFKFILNYFGEDVEGYECGRCDKCSSEDHSLPGGDYLKELILRTFYEAGEELSESSACSILRGSSRNLSLSKLSTFGTCSNYKKEDLQKIIHESYSCGLLERAGGRRNIFYLSPDGKKFLEENNLIEAVQENLQFDYEDNLELFHLLREVRETASKKFMQSAFLICPDEVLKEISQQKPDTKDKMLDIPGFNNRMFNKLGNDFLDIVNDFLSTKKGKPVTAPAANELPQNIVETLHLLKKGYSLQDIASLRKLSEPVISMQIETILEYDSRADIEHLFPDNLFEKITEEIAKGFEDLKELKQRLPQEATYPLLRIAVAKAKAFSQI